MPKPPEAPKKKPTEPLAKKPGEMIDQPDKLYTWHCPVCRRAHHGFSRNVCRNELCDMHGREASN